MKVKSESEVAQSCPTPSDPMDCSLPGSSIHGIFQARVLEWGAIAFSLPDGPVINNTHVHWKVVQVRFLVRELRSLHAAWRSKKKKKIIGGPILCDLFSIKYH